MWRVLFFLQSNENSGREFIELKFPSEVYITGFELYETYKPGSVYRVSSTPSYADDNTVACCGPDFPPGGQCLGYPVCSNLSEWNILWSGKAGSQQDASNIFQPQLCPLRYKSQVVRVDLDTEAAPGWNNFDGARLTGTLDLPPGDVIPDAEGNNAVVYVPIGGTHGIDTFDFQLSDCMGYGPDTIVTLSMPAPAAPFEVPYMVFSASQNGSFAGGTIIPIDLNTRTTAGAFSMYETLRAQTGLVQAELRALEGPTSVGFGPQLLLRPGDVTNFSGADWQPELHVAVVGLGRAEVWFSNAGGSLTFRVQIVVTAPVPLVGLGVLLPMFGTAKSGHTSHASWSPRVGVYQALREINNKSDGVSDQLLPNTRIEFAFYDDKCDSSEGLAGALALTRGVSAIPTSAIIGAGCSSASLMAAQVAELHGIPIVSPSSHSPDLSDGKEYPFFLRTVPADNLLAPALVDVLTNLLGYTSFALAHSTDSYSAVVASSFISASNEADLRIRTIVQFVPNTDTFPHQILKQSRARVIVLFTHAQDGSNFMRTAVDAEI